MGCDRPDWLPVGWSVTVKPRRGSGKKDKYYTNPSKGLKFKSMPEVLRYLKCSRKDQKTKNSVKIEVRDTVPGKLPPGWIKEVRTKHGHGGKIRRDPTYIDPVSGRRFRSMQEVFRYLESKNSRKTRSKPDASKPRHHLPTRAEEQGLIDKKVDKNSIRHEHVRSGPKLKYAVDMKSTRLEQRDEEVCLAVEFSDKLQKGKQQPDKLRELEKLADNKVVVKDQIPKSGAVNEKGQCNDGRRQSKRLADIQIKDNVTTDHSGSKGYVDNNINKGESSKRKRAGDLPRRTSPRLARVEVSLEVRTRTKAEGDVEEDVSNMKNIGNGKAGPGQLDKPETDTKGKSPKCTTDYRTNDHLKRPITPGDQKSLGSTLENLLMDPCIEFAIKTLTGAIPIEDASSFTNTPPSSSSPLPSSVDIWADPCFEFAVKTLTGEAPAQLQSHPGHHVAVDGCQGPAVPKFRSEKLYT